MGAEQDAESHDPRVNQRVAEMRQLLIEMQAIDTASALRSLRRAFPNAPLADRVRALSGTVTNS
jgi:hypothetical protein